MGIVGNSDGVATLTTGTVLCLAAACLVVTLMTAAIRIRVRLPRPPVSGAVGRLAPVLGFALVLAGGPARAERRTPTAPPIQTGGAPPPWSDASGFPPPRPLARIEAKKDHAAHPALHAHRTDQSHVALFPRGHGREETDRKRERAKAMRQHPAGKALNRYVVRDGDTLWSIAQRELQTEDIRSIARFWPKIHRANRDSIPDPSFIMPGQVLVIPDTKES